MEFGVRAIYVDRKNLAVVIYWVEIVKDPVNRRIVMVNRPNRGDSV